MTGNEKTLRNQIIDAFAKSIVTGLCFAGSKLKCSISLPFNSERPDVDHARAANCSELKTPYLTSESSRSRFSGACAWRDGRTSIFDEAWRRYWWEPRNAARPRKQSLHRGKSFITTMCWPSSRCSPRGGKCPGAEPWRCNGIGVSRGC